MRDPAATLRLGFISPFPPEQSGIADYAAVLADALAEAGVQVERAEFDGARITTPAEARVWLRRFDPDRFDLLHVEIGGGRLREFLILEAIRATGCRVPVTATVHDPERLVWRPFPLKVFRHAPKTVMQALTVLMDPLALRRERRAAASVTRLVALTQRGAEALSDRMRIPPDRIAVIPHGVALIPAAPLPPTGRLHLLYFGFIHRGKGIEDLIEALAVLAGRRPGLAAELRLTLAGGTSPDLAFGPHGGYLPGLQARIHALGLDGIVSFRFDLPSEAVPELLQSHHALVLPYKESQKLLILGRQRGTSGSLAWALACGRGVIASDARAFAEEMRHDNGTIVPQGDVGRLADAIAHLIENPETAQRWSLGAEAVARTRTWPETAQKFAKLFRQVAARQEA